MRPTNISALCAHRIGLYKIEAAEIQRIENPISTLHTVDVYFRILT